jgi:hypothetical protein
MQGLLAARSADEYRNEFRLREAAMVGRGPERRVDLKARLACKGPGKMLAIDGGGVWRPPVVETNSVGVFVSYNHSEAIIANALVETLTSLSPELDVFIDHAGLDDGDDYEAKISSSIRSSQWFVIIYSGGGGKPDKDMSWCFYEAGQFRAKLKAENQVKAVRDRICYLYDGELPSQLSRY